jgi:hypothetical protein
MDGRNLACAVAVAAALLSTGCVPQASGSLDVPAALPNASLFRCTESVLRQLHARDSHWNIRISLRDAPGGRLETGNFPESNIMGYRLRLTRAEGAPRASLHIRAAGPYFTDLGAERALASFKTPLTACVAQTPAIR